MIRTLIFDLDETLVDRQATMCKFLQEQYVRFADKLLSPKNEFAETILRLQKNGYEDKYVAYQKGCTELGEDITLAAMMYDDLKEKYGFEAVLFDGTKAILENLRNDYTLALISNGRTRGQIAKMQSTGIYSVFSVIKISEQVEMKKPDPRIFRLCLAELRAKPSDCIYIGDNPANDIIPAKAIGMKAIWYRSRVYPAPVESDGVINNLSELPEVLKRGIS